LISQACDGKGDTAGQCWYIVRGSVKKTTDLADIAHITMSQLLQPEIFRAAVESLRVGLYFVDRDRRIVLWNDGAERITGYLRQEVIGKLCSQQLLNHCGHQGGLLCGANECPLKQCMQEGRTREAYIFLQHKLGHRVPVHVWAVPVLDSSGAIIGAAESFEEEHHDAIADPMLRAENLAVHHCLDLSCEVPNHLFTRSHLREQLTIFAEHGLPFGVLCVSVREFEHFNGAYGRSGAEAVLRMVVGTVKHYVGPGDFVGRWAENKFIAVLSGCTQRQLEELGNSINRILDDSEIAWWGDRLHVSVSVSRGMVEMGDTIELLLKRVERTTVNGNSTKHQTSGGE
jgi:PAS domain S-box-containing protein/diguanylate cyclase (GGDEF)-like protein